MKDEMNNNDLKTFDWWRNIFPGNIHTSWLENDLPPTLLYYAKQFFLFSFMKSHGVSLTRERYSNGFITNFCKYTRSDRNVFIEIMKDILINNSELLNAETKIWCKRLSKALRLYEHLPLTFISDKTDNVGLYFLRITYQEDWGKLRLIFARSMVEEVESIPFYEVPEKKIAMIFTAVEWKLVKLRESDHVDS